MKYLRLCVPILGALALSLALVVACSSSPEEDGPEGSLTELPEPEDALSEPLMLALSQAKNFHHKADVYLKLGKIEEATDAVQKILYIPFPKSSPEGEDVKLDARARLGKLLLRQDELDAAAEVVDAGIDATERESFFLANLYRVRGQVLAARGDQLAETDEEAAKAIRKDAIRAFDRSIQISEKLLEKLPKEPPQ